MLPSTHEMRHDSPCARRVFSVPHLTPGFPLVAFSLPRMTSAVRSERQSEDGLLVGTPESVRQARVMVKFAHRLRGFAFNFGFATLLRGPVFRMNDYNLVPILIMSTVRRFYQLFSLLLMQFCMGVPRFVF